MENEQYFNNIIEEQRLRVQKKLDYLLADGKMSANEIKINDKKIIEGAEKINKYRYNINNKPYVKL